MRILETKVTREFKAFQGSLIRSNRYITDVVFITMRLIDGGSLIGIQNMLLLHLRRNLHIFTHIFNHRINKLRKPSSGEIFIPCLPGLD